MDGGVEIIKRKTAYSGFLELARYQLRIPVVGAPARVSLERECVEGLRSAAVLPFDPAAGRIVLISQFRIGALGSAEGAWLLEPPGGVIAGKEDPAETVRREAWEEAGCCIGAMRYIGACRTSPGFSDERVELFCGAVDSAGLRPTGGMHADGEWTEVVTMDLDTAIRDLGQGALTAATAIIALQWLALNHRRLRELWG